MSTSSLSTLSNPHIQQIAYVVGDRTSYKWSFYFSEKFSDLFYKTFFLPLTNKHNLMLLAQENLAESGSFNLYHKRQLLKFIRNKQGNNFRAVEQGLQQMLTVDDLSLFFNVNFNKKRLVEASKKSFIAIYEDGKDFWLDLTSKKAHHALKGRFYKSEDGRVYFQLANTGFGIEHYPHLHKSIEIQGKTLYQVVVEWGPIDKETFDENFFDAIYKASIKGVTSSIDANNECKSDFYYVKIIYDTISKYFTGISLKNIKEPISNCDTAYWSRDQIGGSCVPNSFLAIIRTILTNQEFIDLMTDIKLKNLFKLVKRIKLQQAGRTSHVAALETINYLCKNSQNEANLATFDVTKQWLTRTSFQHNVKLKAKWNDSLEGNLFLIDLIKVKRKLNAKVYLASWPVIEGSPSKVIIDFSSSTDLIIKSFILYQAIIKGKNKLCNKINEFLKALSLYKQGDGKIEHLYLAHAFMHLSDELRSVDETAEGRTRQRAISKIAYLMYEIYINDNQCDSKYATYVWKNIMRCYQESKSFYNKAEQDTDSQWQVVLTDPKF